MSPLLVTLAAQFGLAGGAATAAWSVITRSFAAEPDGEADAVAPSRFPTRSAAQRIEVLGDITLLDRAASADEIAAFVGYVAPPRSAPCGPTAI